MITAAIFDLDGTLVSLPINWEALFDKLKHIMHVDSVRPLAVAVSQVDRQTQLEVFSAWDAAELAVVENVTVCKEGMDIYRENAQKPKALVTLQGEKVVAKILNQFELNFDVVITREYSLNREEQLCKAIEVLKPPVEEVLFIGNADSDVVAAKKLGCQFQRVKC